jgi:ubiquinone/menaquinone biosynthesis C-methylase UbiE
MEQAQKLPDFADIFERLLVPAIFDRYARDLVDRTRPIGPSDRILDLGCGTGIVARILRERLGGGARITGLDINAGMLAKARSIAPDIEWVEGSATALPFVDRSFEVVIAQQVLQFVPDREAAMREIRRVLVPGGRLIASTWRPRTYQPLFDALGLVAEKHLGPGNDKRWTLDSDELGTLATTAGFVDVRLDTASLEERHRTVPIQASTAASGYTNVDPATMAAIESESKPILARHTAEDGSITNRSVTNVIVARVP